MTRRYVTIYKPRAESSNISFHPGNYHRSFLFNRDLAQAPAVRLEHIILFSKPKLSKQKEAPGAYPRASFSVHTHMRSLCQLIPHSSQNYSPVLPSYRLTCLFIASNDSSLIPCSSLQASEAAISGSTPSLINSSVRRVCRS